MRKTQFPRLVIPLTVVLTAFFNLCLNLSSSSPSSSSTASTRCGPGCCSRSCCWPCSCSRPRRHAALGPLRPLPRRRDHLGRGRPGLFYGTPILYPITHPQKRKPQAPPLINPLAPIFEQVRVWMIDPKRRPPPRWSAAPSACCPRSRSSSASACSASGSSTATRRDRRAALGVWPCRPAPVPLRQAPRPDRPDGRGGPHGHLRTRAGCTGRCSTTPSARTGAGTGSGSSTSAAASAGCCGISCPRPSGPSSTAATSTPPASSGWSRILAPVHDLRSSEKAGLPQEDGFFDLIYAFSVYTHFTDNWAEWLLEHHRVLADGGSSSRPSSARGCWRR